MKNIVILDGCYNGCCNASIEYINKKMGDKKILKKAFVRNSIKTIGNFSKAVFRDVIDNKDILTSVKHNGYKCLSDPFKKWTNKKIGNDEVLKTFANGAFKAIDSFVIDLLDDKNHLFKINGKFNNKLIDDFFKDLVTNEKNAFEKLFVEKVKETLIKRINEEKKKRRN